MVEGDFDRETVEYTGTRYAQSGSQGSGIRREPSFSGWFDEDGKVQLDSELRNTDAAVEEDSDFELPFLQQVEVKNSVLNSERYTNNKFQETRMHSGDGDTMDDSSVHLHGNGNEKYVPFDVENAPRLSNDLDGSVSKHKFRILPSNSDNPIDVANVLKTLIFILVWFIFSLFLTLYNKSLLGDDLGKFPAPLLMNTVHFAMQAVLSKAILWCWPHRFQSSVAMSWRDYFMRVVPTALGTALDVDLSNASLVSISVTFATMCKSAAPIFLLLFAFAFRLESPSIRLSGIILVISTGILLTVAKDTEFNLWGFILVMLAAVMSGFRWCMTQILLQLAPLLFVFGWIGTGNTLLFVGFGAKTNIKKESYGLKNPLALMSYVTPVMTVATLLLSVILDPWDEFRKNIYFNSPHHITRSVLLMLFGGALAFFMVLTEFILVSVTSAVTVTIAGVVKEAITILVAVIYFHDEFTWLKGAGLFTIMVGVSLFNWYKYQRLQSGEASDDDNESLTSNVDAKYVILDDVDGQDDCT